MSKKELSFDEKSHTYSVGTKKLISVTQLLDRYKQPFDAESIINKMFEKSVSENLYIGPKREYIGMTKEQINTIWDINRISKSAYGTFIHKGAEKIGDGIKNGMPNCFKPNTQEFKQVVKFFKDEDYEIVEQELRIYSEELGVAGTVDLLLKDGDGRYCILDWKTNSGKDLEEMDNNFCGCYKSPIDNVPATKFWHYALQMSVYRYILEHKGVYKPEEFGDMYIIHLIGSIQDLKKNGRQVVYPEMKRATYKKILVPYMKSEAMAIIEELRDESN